MRFFLIITFAVINIFCLSGQQRNQFSLFTQNYYQQNAAFGGFERAISLNMLYRSQWNQLPNRPRAYYFGMHMPLFSINSGIGFDLQNEEEGLLNIKSIRASFNHITPLGFGIVSIGGRLGLVNFQFNGDKALTPEGTYIDGIVIHNDPLLPTSQLGAVGVEYELGVFLETSVLRLGLTYSDFPKHKIKGQDFTFTLSPNFSLFLQYNYQVNRQVQIQPSLSMRYSGAQLQTDISLLSQIYGNIFGGLVLRGYDSNSLDAVGLLLGHKMNKNWTLYYVYDIGVSALRQVHDGSHEILLKCNLYDAVKQKTAGNIIYNPRFL